jgi:MaoC like domain
MISSNFVGATVFDDAAIQFFAKISGDMNPMHVDRHLARRLMAGKQVVHGMLLVLVAVGKAQSVAWKSITGLSADFLNPVCVDDVVDFHQVETSSLRSVLDAKVGELMCARIYINFDELDTAEASTTQCSDQASAKLQAHTLDALSEPMTAVPIDLIGKIYEINVREDCNPGKLLDASAHKLGERIFSALCRLSFVVGMVCPGLHSVFSNFSVRLNSTRDDTTGVLFAHVRKFDERFSLFNISVFGCLNGEIRAFLRPQPSAQQDISELSRLVVPCEFGQTRSLIVGGSRGLGEVTGKIVALGGGDTLITYASGFTDALRVKEQIDSVDQKTDCSLLKFDVEGMTFDSLDLNWNEIDITYFFATPRIFRKKGDLYHRGVMADFLTFYVDQFYALCCDIESKRKTGKVVVFYPSTVSIDARPKGVTEYSAAKAAAEIVVQDVNRWFRRVHIVVERLPRIGTDQTSTVLPIESLPPAQVMIPIIRGLTKLAREL